MVPIPQMTDESATTRRTFAMPNGPCQSASSDPSPLSATISEPSHQPQTRSGRGLAHAHPPQALNPNDGRVAAAPKIVVPLNVDDGGGRRGGALRSRGRSVLCMSLSLAVHLGGYEVSRAAVMALFTSDSLGFGRGAEGGLSALPMAVGCVSPFSVALLWFYAGTLASGGPSHALRMHTLICAGTQILAGLTLGACEKRLNDEQLAAEGAALTRWLLPDVGALSRPLLFAMFVVQNAYVQLLYNQHWAFIGSVLTPEEGTRVFAPIAGLGSIGSTLAAGMISILVDRLGLIGLLHVSGASYIASAILAELAFSIARTGGFEPRGDDNRFGGVEASGDMKPNGTKAGASSYSINKGTYLPINGSKDTAVTLSAHTKSILSRRKGNVFEQAYALFQRVPVLGALFLETVVSQCLSSLVNFSFLSKLKETVTDDAQRAGWSGSFYAWINGISGVFQFFAIPILLKCCEAQRFWLFMPALMLCCTLFAASHSAGLLGAGAPFFIMKTMEYSLRAAANEMLYVSLDYESRYLGKKAICLMAGKFGKSAMAVALSVLMVIYGNGPGTRWYLSAATTGFTFLWMLLSVRLHSLIDASK